MDIVYPLSEQYDGEELRFSLRSLQNIPHDMVFFVGGCPGWAQNIIHIPMSQKGTKYKNTTKAMIKVCNDTRVSEDFILMNDDFFILEKTTPEELNLYNGTVQSNLDAQYKKYGTANPYMRGMEQTRDLLKNNGVPEPLCYELHIPFVFNKHKFLNMFDLREVERINCLHKRTLYGNLYLNGGKDTRDVKIFARNGFFGQAGAFLSCSNDGFDLIKSFLSAKFPKKSVYEV